MVLARRHIHLGLRIHLALLPLLRRYYPNKELEISYPPAIGYNCMRGYDYKRKKW